MFRSHRDDELKFNIAQNDPLGATAIHVEKLQCFLVVIIIIVAIGDIIVDVIVIAVTRYDDNQPSICLFCYLFPFVICL